MEIGRYKEVERVFVEVVELGGDLRRAKIRQLTDDSALIESVEVLLNEHDRLSGDDFLESAVLGEAPRFEAGSGENGSELPSKINGYSILRVLGKGTSGMVYLAQSPLPLERLVALKLINRGAGEQSLARFREEQRILARMQHPGIAEVYDEGVVDGHRPFTVLEYIEGGSITEYCRSRRLGWGAICRLMIQCCDALTHAHQRNIIHRDLKPSNLLVTEKGIPEGSSAGDDAHALARVKIIDFGIAKLVDPVMMMTQLTIDTQFVGTLPYTSPEQLIGADTPDTRTDVHALGIVLFECIAGCHPFFAESVGLKETIDTIVSRPIPGIGENAGSAQRELNAILSRACAKDPGERYPSPMHLGEDLENLLKGLPVLAMRPRPVYLARKFFRRHLVALTIAGVVFISLFLLGGVAIKRGIQATQHRDALRETAIRFVDDLMPMLADLSGSGQARRELAASLHQRIDELLAADPTDRELLLRKASVLEHESDMLLEDHHRDESEFNRVEALRLIQVLLESDAGNARLQVDERRLLIKIGDIAKDRSEFAAAEGYYRQVHRMLAALPGDHREGLCWSLERLSWVTLKQKRRVEAAEIAEMRRSLAVELVNEKPQDSDLVYNAASANQLLADIQISLHDYQPALERALDAAAYSSVLIALSPDKYSSQVMELRAATVCMIAMYWNEKISQADEQRDRIIRLVEEYVANNPSRSDVRKTASAKLEVIREWQHFLGREQEAQAIRLMMHELDAETHD